MHITDWYPTLLHLAGYQEEKPGQSENVEPLSNTPISNNKGSLDGVNNWASLVSEDVESARSEILHNINPMYNSRFLWFQCGKSLAPTTSFENKHNVDTSRGNAALRMNQWKLIIGDPG